MGRIRDNAVWEVVEQRPVREAAWVAGVRSDRIVWDGAIPHIAARQLALNFRFAIAGGAAGPFQPGSESVLWWSDYEDKTRGRPTAGLLDRCRKSNTCPKIFETFGALEFWYLRESPNLVGTGAKSDIPLPPNVRLTDRGFDGPWRRRLLDLPPCDPAEYRDGTSGRRHARLCAVVR